jgi:hypothetical protein
MKEGDLVGQVVVQVQVVAEKVGNLEELRHLLSQVVLVVDNLEDLSQVVRLQSLKLVSLGNVREQRDVRIEWHSNSRSVVNLADYRTLICTFHFGGFLPGVTA